MTKDLLQIKEHKINKIYGTLQEELEAVTFELGTSPVPPQFYLVEELFKRAWQQNRNSYLPQIPGM